MRWYRDLLVILLIEWRWMGTRSQFAECHDDGTYDPEEGTLETVQYTWLGVLQYIHVRNGTPHYFRAPRVVLISRLFVISTAVDAAILPDGYALGNVVFGEYERDERECGLTVPEMLLGGVCERATLILPLSDVLLHPEFKHFGAPDSIALLKLLTPVKSQYMTPVCLPFKNFLRESRGRPSAANPLWHVDFSSDVPRDFTDEEKEVSKINMLPKELCFLYDPAENVTNVAKKRIMCSTNCGFHSGAPTVVHEHTGHWTLVAISLGGAPCPDPLRARRPPAPPRHVLLFPYVPWITAAISGRAVGSFAKDDPFGYTMPRSETDLELEKIHDQFHGWVGHWWMGGIRCYDRGDNALDLFKFYHEVFQVTPAPGETRLTYYLQVYGPLGTSVVCLKVGLPYRMGKPLVWDLDSSEVQLKIPLNRLLHRYKFHVEGYAYNVSLELEADTESEGHVETVASASDPDSMDSSL